MKSNVDELDGAIRFDINVAGGDAGRCATQPLAFYSGKGANQNFGPGRRLAIREFIRIQLKAIHYIADT